MTENINYPTVDLAEDMAASYFAYSHETITDRALPRVEDGLKPVQRRILYAMAAMGLNHNRPHKKSARVVGEVLGKFHPHGDSAVYMAAVRLAQDFSMRFPLIDGQGNFGSIDGDSPAAMRYTECRLTALAEEMMRDLESDTVPWQDNFDGALQEPEILPTVVPNLLINGSSGVAVGLATNIPPHNLGEVCAGLIYVAQHWDNRAQITVDDLMAFIPGPDFPTGGIIYRYRADVEGDVIRKAYATGQGRLICQGRIGIEETKGGKADMIITELPYQIQKSTLLERIGKEIRDGRLTGITDVRDESDYEGLRVVIEVSRMAKPAEVLEALLTRTQLRNTFGVNALALVKTEAGTVVPHYMTLFFLTDS